MFTSHSLVMNNLTGGTQYQYRVRSTDANGNVTTSDVKSFTTNTNSSGGSSPTASPTATPTPKPAGSATATPTPISGGATSGEITPTTTPAPTTMGSRTSNLKLPSLIGFTVAMAEGVGFIFLTSLILQGVGVIKVGFLDKVIRFILRIN